MKKILAMLAAVAAFGLVSAPNADAGGRVSWSITVGGGSHCGPSYHGHHGGGYHRVPSYGHYPRHHYRVPRRPVYVAPCVPQRPIYRCAPYRPPRCRW